MEDHVKIITTLVREVDYDYCYIVLGHGTFKSQKVLAKPGSVSDKFWIALERQINERIQSSKKISVNQLFDIFYWLTGFVPDIMSRGGIKNMALGYTKPIHVEMFNNFGIIGEEPEMLW